MAITLNKHQQMAVLAIDSFIKEPIDLIDLIAAPLHGFLLTGPAGSGKTSVIINVFNNYYIFYITKCTVVTFL